MIVRPALKTSCIWGNLPSFVNFKIGSTISAKKLRKLFHTKKGVRFEHFSRVRFNNFLGMRFNNFIGVRF